MVLRNADAAILAEAGGRQVYQDRPRATPTTTARPARCGSPARPGSRSSTWPRSARACASTPWCPTSRSPCRWGPIARLKWIANYDNQFKGPIPMRQALAESRNAVGGVDHPRDRRGPDDPDGPGAGDPDPAAALHHHRAGRVGGAAAGAGRRLPRHGLRAPGRAPRHRSRDRRLRRGALRGAPGARRGIGFARPEPDPGGAARRGPSPGRHRPRPRQPRLPDPGDGQDRDDERLPRRAVRGIHLRAAGDHGRGPDRLRRQPRARREGDRRPHGAADLPRDHAPRLRAPARGAGAVVPARDRGRDRRYLAQTERDSAPVWTNAEWRAGAGR